MNKLTIIGNLTRDPELRTTTTGVNVCDFTVAVNRRQRRDAQGGQPEADFFRVTAWRERGALCAKYLAKGRKVAIEGRIQTGSYENKEGQKVYTTDVVASRVEFLSTGNQSSGGGSFGGGQQSFNDTSAPANSGASDVPPGFNDLQDDDIPF